MAPSALTGDADHNVAMLLSPLSPCYQDRLTVENVALRSLNKTSLTTPTQNCYGQIRSYPSMASPARGDDFALLVKAPPMRKFSLSAEPNQLLTALATQERRVLEMREDLQKAEADLEKLKKQWAASEMNKKKSEIRHMEQLQPISSSTRKNTIEMDGHIPYWVRNREQQKPSGTRTRYSQRKVFSGSKHTRTLSLLSPDSPIDDEKRWPEHKQLSEKRIHRKGRTPPKIATTPNITPSFKVQSGLSNSTQHPTAFPKEDLVSTGRQLVGDLREGLWTFIEDLRQAAVGEDVVNCKRSRYPPNVPRRDSPAGQRVKRRPQPISKRPFIPSVDLSDTTGMPNDPPISREPSNLTLADKITTSGPASLLEGQESKPETSKRHLETKTDSISLDDDGWENWDSPSVKATSPAWSLHQSEPIASPTLDSNSSRTSIR